MVSPSSRGEQQAAANKVVLPMGQTVVVKAKLVSKNAEKKIKENGGVVCLRVLPSKFNTFEAIVAQFEEDDEFKMR
ncbi:hypothetical protein KY285_024063 [Solanum tuberosum]|nr:hypothetical protein KY289_024417 [Solanum tuberosum]KAH0676262.1 hypothetical protein KY285_024063 [Solanum tuberosum]